MTNEQAVVQAFASQAHNTGPIKQEQYDVIKARSGIDPGVQVGVSKLFFYGVYSNTQKEITEAHSRGENPGTTMSIKSIWDHQVRDFAKTHRLLRMNKNSDTGISIPLVEPLR